MKNLITITSILAAGTLCAWAGETITLTSKLSSTSGDSTYSVSLWDLVYGKTTSEISVDDSSGPLAAVGWAAYTELKGNSSTKSYTLSNLYGASELGNLTEVVLSSLSFTTRPDKGTQPENVYLQLSWTEDGVAKTITSSSALSYTNFDGTSTYGCATANFDSTARISVDQSFTVKFVTINESTGATTATSIGVGEFNPYYKNSSGYLVDGLNGYHAAIKVAVTTIPEPSMFGLLAGTLALGLAGTRRRRAK